jgi:hypothetical protein
MARHRPTPTSTEPIASATEAEEQFMTGGASGVADGDDPALASTTIGGPVIRGAVPTQSTDAEPISVMRDRVVNGGYIVYDAGRVAMRAGKIVDSRTHDLALLRRQGIVLEEIGEETAN